MKTTVMFSGDMKLNGIENSIVYEYDGLINFVLDFDPIRDAIIEYIGECTAYKGEIVMTKARNGCTSNDIIVSPIFNIDDIIGIEILSEDSVFKNISDSFGRHIAIANFVFRWLLHGVFLTSIKNRDIDMMKILLEYDADLAWDVEKKKWASPSQCKSNIRLSQLGGGGSHEDL